MFIYEEIKSVVQSHDVITVGDIHCTNTGWKGTMAWQKGNVLVDV